MATAISPIVLSLSRPSMLTAAQFHRSIPSWQPYSPFPFHKSCKNFTYRTLVRRADSGEPDESMFMDENGIIDDMDGYLNYLSLEYDSVWDTKPAWCQPWTITLAGVSMIAFSWLIVNSVLVTGIVFFLIGAWWYVFLYSYPKAYSEMIAERRKRVTDGDEDTYGQERFR